METENVERLVELIGNHLPLQDGEPEFWNRFTWGINFDKNISNWKELLSEPETWEEIKDIRPCDHYESFLRATLPHAPLDIVACYLKREKHVVLDLVLENNAQMLTIDLWNHLDEDAKLEIINAVFDEVERDYPKYLEEIITDIEENERKLPISRKIAAMLTFRPESLYKPYWMLQDYDLVNPLWLKLKEVIEKSEDSISLETISEREEQIREDMVRVKELISLLSFSFKRRTSYGITDELKRLFSTLFLRRRDSLCKDFIDRAIWTWNHIKDCGLTRINVSENTITEINLKKLEKKHPNEIKTRTFNTHEEGRIGADWEWWLGSEDSWLGLRVQAKKINPKTLRYPNLNRKNQHGRQIDLLIEDSRKNYPQFVPVYVFYNYWDTDYLYPLWLFSEYSRKFEMLGCGMSHALAVREVISQGRNGLKDIAEIMYPWSYLVCGEGFFRAKEKLPSRAFSFLSRAFKRYTRDTHFDTHREEGFVSSEAPSYVYKILEGVELSARELSRIKVNRITVIFEKG